MRRILSLVSVVLMMWISGGAWGTTRYVMGSVSASGNGLSWQGALKTIQEGIDASSNGDTVTVAEGVYVENISFDGKNIILTSTDPLAPSTVAATTIDGNQAGSVVTFSGTETEACAVSGWFAVSPSLTEVLLDAKPGVISGWPVFPPSSRNFFSFCAEDSPILGIYRL